jgi:carbonic anhydrase
MTTLQHLFDNNRRWAARMREADPAFFERLEHQQAPEYLWIGCSDSRVPANQIAGLQPGEVFVHRNVGNVLAPGDLNGNAVLQFAVDVLRVRHVIVCGHYGCSGVRAALEDERLGLVDGWLAHLRAVKDRHAALLEGLHDPQARAARLCELNVVEQVGQVCATTAARDAWGRGQPLSVHGWVYGVGDGLLRDLGLTVTSPEQVAEARRRALSTVR